jgi:hypothetical protein
VASLRPMSIQACALSWTRRGEYFNPLAATRLATMDLFDRKLILPVDVMITIAINIVVAVLGYYLVMAWDLFGR